MTRITVMGRKQPYALVFAAQVKQHLRAIEPKYHSLIRAKVEEQLQFDPDKPTNRKRLRKPIAEADWELRFGPDNRFRVFYRIDPESHAVGIVAIGIKERGRLVIGDEEIEP
jgi:mRNA-degrading endonuclease RelE of RelBE toxin-antitoxin system